MGCFAISLFARGHLLDGKEFAVFVEDLDDVADGVRSSARLYVAIGMRAVEESVSE